MNGYKMLKTLYDRDPKVRAFVDEKKAANPYYYNKPFTVADILRAYDEIYTLVKIEFKGYRLCLTNSPYSSITYGGETYNNNGWLEAIKENKESIELNTKGCNIDLKVDLELFKSIVNSKSYIRAPVYVYYAYMGVSGVDVPDAVVPVFKGFVDKITMTMDRNTEKYDKLSIATVNLLQGLAETTSTKTAHSTHIAVVPGDNCLIYSSSTEAAKKQKWTKK